MSEFTKGPWTAKSNSVHWEVVKLDKDGWWDGGIADVCQSDPGGGVNSKTQKANANLIAAAPEMYGMLDRLQKSLADEYLQQSLIIRSLLAKARGENNA